MDIKDISPGIDNLKSYTISRREGSIGTTLNFTVAGITSEFTPGDDDEISFHDTDWIVTSREYAAAESGYETRVNAVSKIGYLAKSSPAKSLMYMSMSESEQDEFELGCKSDYRNLPYIPLIRRCNPETGIGGWSSALVIADLAAKAGIRCVVNCYNYWLKQVEASNTASYFDTILSLVSFLRPIIYSDEDTVYILERPQADSGTAEFPSAKQINQTEVFNFDSKALYFQVNGGYGRWIRAKSRVTAEAETDAQMKTETYSETPLLNVVNMTGTAEVTKKLNATRPDGSQQVQTGKQSTTLRVAYFLDEPMREKHKTVETYRLDPFGNFKALLSRHEIVTREAIGSGALPILDATTEYTYDFLAEKYDKPRLMNSKTEHDEYTWSVGVAGNGLIDRIFRKKARTTCESFAYGPDGVLLEKTTTVAADVIRIALGGGEVELMLADAVWTVGGTETFITERKVIDEMVTRYRQITPTTYEEQSTHRRLGGLARTPGQETYGTSTQILEGRVPMHPAHFRMIPVWADNLPLSGIVKSDVPVVGISNPNLIDWDDADAVLTRIQQLAAESNTVERTFSIPGEIEVDVGWSVTLPEIPLGGQQSIPSVTVPNYCRVIAWSRTKDAGAPSAITTITVESR